MDEAHCKECDALFTKKREWQKFCSPVCRTNNFLRIQKEDLAFARKIKGQNQIRRDLFAA